MTVYVDEAMIPYRGMRMNHLIADTHEELIAMVRKIGVQEKWIQYPGTPKEHFDIAASKRELAIKHGAVPITPLQLGELLMERNRQASMANEVAQ